jgi:hypothetical protein
MIIIKMNHVYVVVENGDPYPAVYTSFAAAASAAKDRHAKTIEEELLEAGGEPICSDLDVPENVIKGKTSLYVEKGIFIEIYKLPIL